MMWKLYWSLLSIYINCNIYVYGIFMTMITDFDVYSQ